MKNTGFWVIVVIVALTVLPAVVAADDLDTYFRERLGLKDADIKDVAAGKVISVVVDNEDNREVAVVGIARTSVTSEFLLASFPDFVAIRDQDGVLGVGQISQPPVRGDFDNVLFPKDDLTDLLSCKAGKCNVKLTQPAFDYLESMRGDLTTEADVNQAMQQFLFARTQQYVSGGLSALDPYADKKEQQSVTEAVKTLLNDADFYMRYFAGLNGYFQDYPGNPVDGAHEYLYWSLEKFGLKPTMRLQHAVTYEDPDPLIDAVIVQLGYYASHYLVVSFTMTLFVQADLDGHGVANYVIVATRQLFDNEVKGLKRNNLNGQLKKGMVSQLERERDRLQAKGQ